MLVTLALMCVVVLTGTNLQLMSHDRGTVRRLESKNCIDKGNDTVLSIIVIL